MAEYIYKYLDACLENSTRIAGRGHVLYSGLIFSCAYINKIMSIYIEEWIL